MKLHPTELRRVGASRYRVRIDAISPTGTHEFEFSVTGDDIRCVETPPEFDALVHHNVGPMKSLLAAVLAFDAAQGVVVPD